ncbi:5-oxoprolinase subunit PxpB [Fluviispira multicolorata]|uniref:5-oxoprolinase subunit PxpB n=1 Tax=Fluviispira multicolorata TaxID=2654512 RepID=UPI0013758C39|nr:5-oxoprolinase subunit PxpB [Fluviispira multicolorata]
MNLKSIHCYILNEYSIVLESSQPVHFSFQQKLWWITENISLNSNIIDVIIGMNNLTVVLNPTNESPSNFLPKLEMLWQQAQLKEFKSREILIPVKYGNQYGPDLNFIAQNSKLSIDEVINIHSNTEYLVYFLGFQPGFAYLEGLSPILATPRRESPRFSVPAGSVGIGGNLTGIYPQKTPGGWNIIGQTNLTLFNPNHFPPTLLQPGDKVRFIPDN